MNGIAKSAIVLLLTASLLLNGCAKQIEDNKLPDVTEPPVTNAEETTTTKEENVPSFTVPGYNSNTQATTTTDKVDELIVSSKVTEPSSEQTTSNAPVTSHDIVTEEQITNSEGVIVDNFLSEMVFDTEDPDELYDMFGLDRNGRKEFYDEISEKYNFPIIHVSTENKKDIVSREDYLNCLVEVFNCDEYYTMDAVSGGIRVRGNASAYYGDVDKILKNGAPYRIKFTNKQNILGLNDDALCKSWVLLKPYSTGVNDYLGLHLAAAINEGNYYSSDSAFVQLYINEKYHGIYILAEQTQVNGERIDITEPEVGYTGNDIGFLVELDNYATAEDYWFILNYNKEELTDDNGTTRVPRKYYYSVKSDIYAESQKDFIERYFEIAYEVAMRAIKYGEFYKVNDDLQSITLAQDEFSSARECIEQIWDIQSMVDMYITHELTNNMDGGGGSFFFAIDFAEDSKLTKLTCVSPWDFDWAYADGNSDADGGLYVANFKNKAYIDIAGDRSNPWMILFYSADWFKDMVKETWADRVDDIQAVTDDTRKLVENNTSDFNAYKKLTGRANGILNWVDERIEYLNEVWN